MLYSSIASLFKSSGSFIAEKECEEIVLQFIDEQSDLTDKTSNSSI